MRIVLKVFCVKTIALLFQQKLFSGVRVFLGFFCLIHKTLGESHSSKKCKKIDNRKETWEVLSDSPKAAIQHQSGTTWAEKQVNKAAENQTTSSQVSIILICWERAMRVRVSELSSTSLHCCCYYYYCFVFSFRPQDGEDGAFDWYHYHQYVYRYLHHTPTIVEGVKVVNNFSR